MVEKFVFQLEAQLGDRNITIELTPEANTWLAERGYDDKFGARPLARVIQEHIKKPLAEEILFGALKDGGIVRVLVEEKEGEKAARLRISQSRHADQAARSRGSPILTATGPRAAGLKARRKRHAKPRVKRGAAQAAGRRQRSVGASLVPKVPLGSK